MPAELTIIRPRRGLGGINLAELWRYHELLFVLALREIQLRYKQTILGVAWAIIQPLATAGVFAVLLRLLMGAGNEPGMNGVPYLLTTFCAMLPWQFFANSLTQAGGSLVSNQRLITKVYFPRMVIPMAGVLGVLADLLVAMLALAGLMALAGVMPGAGVLLLPLFVLLATVAAVGAGFWLSAAAALYRDFRYVVPFIVQIGLFVSPVIYTAESIRHKLPAWAMVIYSLNPMAGAIEGFRWSLLGGTPPALSMLLLSTISAVVLLGSGAMYFRAMERWFADLI